ncbi:MAG TPA: hypothetical protein VFT14_06110 [Solirubrobacterales bacterium]|nr:hypothetical protein [Solirubrobacterales bacterium]
MFEIEPAFFGFITIVTVAVDPGAIVPRGQVTVLPARSHVPCDGVAETKFACDGSVSVTITPVASALLFWTWTV